MSPLSRHRVALLVSVIGLAACSQTENSAETRTREESPEGYQSRGELRTGYIYAPDGRPRRISFEVHGGEAVIEGDILLGPPNTIAATPQQLLGTRRSGAEGPSLGVVTDGASRRWPSGVVPYEIDPALPSKTRVTDAIAKIKTATPGVNIVPRSGQSDYIRFLPSTGCSSYVGRIGGMQPVNLADNCSTGNTMHEITHALGLYHEQSRCDRNSYVQILYANIQAGYESNFDSFCQNATDLFAYAEGSIMHYSPYAFSANGQPTIRSLRGLDYLMGQRDGYGPTDVSTVAQLYPTTGNRWLQRAPMPTARRELATGTATGLLYAIGGVNATGAVLTSVQAYNPGTNSWTTKAALPAPRWRGNGTATINGVLYLAGGVDGTKPGHRNTLYVYTAASNTWSTKASMPVAGGCGGSGAINGIVYVLVGCDSLTSQTAGAKGLLFRYDPATNAWSTKASSPIPHQFPAVAVQSGKFYVIGGKNGAGAPTTVVHVYTPSTNTWATKAPLPSARYRATATAVAGKLYVVGGNDVTGTYTNTVYVYDPASNVWSTAATMPTARANLSSGVISNVLYSVGGQNSSAAVLATTEAFTP